MFFLKNSFLVLIALTFPLVATAANVGVQEGFSYIVKDGGLDKIVVTGAPAEAMYNSPDALILEGAPERVFQAFECFRVEDTPNGAMIKDVWTRVRVYLQAFIFGNSTETRAATALMNSTHVCLLDIRAAE
jgi:hypothetical protein